MDLLLIGSLGMAAFDYSQHPAQYSSDALWRVLFYYALFVTVDYLAAVLAFALERAGELGVVDLAVLAALLLPSVDVLRGDQEYLTSLRGALVGWGKLERKATVQATG